MFMAAFTSRLTTLPHLGQAHSLSLRVTSLLMYPHVLGSLVLGSNFPISKMLVPRQSALYFRNMQTFPNQHHLLTGKVYGFLSYCLLPNLQHIPYHIAWLSHRLLYVKSLFVG